MRTRCLVTLMFLPLIVGVQGTAGAATAQAGCGSAWADPSPFGTTPCPGVRPGGVVLLEPPVLSDYLPLGPCTLGFMFKHRGNTLMSTAGHCAQFQRGTETVWASGTGPIAYDLHEQRIGEFVYAVYSGASGVADLDFALIRLDKGVEASPEVCHFGGPTGINGETVPLGTPVLLHYYGNTIAGGFVPNPVGRWGLPARTGLSNGLPSQSRVYFNGHVSVFDSGGPIITSDGRAVALVSQAGDTGEDGYTGLAGSPRIGPQIERAESMLGGRLHLVTA